MTPDKQHVDEQALAAEQLPPPDGATAGAAAAPAGAGEEQLIAPGQVAQEADTEAQADGPDGPSEEDALAQLRERAARADEYLALAQRTQADFENFRKRMTRDLRAAESRGTGRLAKELLPAFDNLERALAAIEADEHEDHDLTKGIRLVQAELTGALGRSGIECFAPKGERFDPAEHDAVAQQPFEGTDPGTVLEVLQAGYRLNGAILRPARVIVSG